MYLYESEGLGECNITGKWARLGPGTDPIGAEKELCPLIRDDMSGRYTDWTDYILRTRNPKDPRSKFKAFRDEDCYKAYIERCKQFSQPVRFKPPRLVPIPEEPNYLDCFIKCRREVEKCPGGRMNVECKAKGRECMRNCQGALA